MARARPVLLGALAAAAVAAGIVVAALQLQQPPDGPAPVAWDREACAHCHMHVGEPAFAAQLHTTDGRVLHFDDPGCLLTRLAAGTDELHALWFRHVHEERWISGAEVGFVRVEPTPMGYGIGAVERSTAGAISLADATALVVKAEGARR